MIESHRCDTRLLQICHESAFAGASCAARGGLQHDDASIPYRHLVGATRRFFRSWILESRLPRFDWRATRVLLTTAAMLASTSLVAAESSSATELLRDASAAEARLDPRAALELYLRIDALKPDDPTILQKISRQYSDLSVDAADKKMKRKLCAEALAYGERAVALEPDKTLNLVSLAICHGQLGELCDLRTRVNHSRRVKQYAEQALALAPDNDYAHHVLGRWHYEVASLGAASRLVLKLVYGGLPDASTAEAVRHLQRAVELAPNVPGHRLALGFALLADGQRTAARDAFERGLALPPCEKYEDEIRPRAQAELDKLAKD
jgi:tetratricopeptide (TPR) repeat protein